MPARVVNLDEVWAALDQCAKGWTANPSTEYWRVNYNGKTYHRLPLGKHGKRVNPEVEAGHVRTMARSFGIETCFRRALPGIYN
jgi:hypothetical protein